MPFRWGAWGVPLFFVISGYCIHRPHVRKLEGKHGYQFGLREYYARRLWRIYPTLFAALVLTAACDYLVKSTNPAGSDLGNNSVSCFIANLLTLQNISAPTYGCNGPLWTLSIELHFYFVYPLIFWAVRRRGALSVTSAVFVISVGVWLACELAGRLSGWFFLPYWFSWVLGAYVAESETGRVRFSARWMTILAVICTILAITVQTWGRIVLDPQPAVFTLLSFPFALLVWFAVKRQPASVCNGRVARSLAMIGIFSYSLYASHLPVLITYRAVVQRGSQSTFFISVLPGALVAIAVAYAMYLLVERWTLRLPARLSRFLAGDSERQERGATAAPAVKIDRGDAAGLDASGNIRRI
jgi:peptidoglycan/LPS O-acetylase OafA/YrhL